MIICMWFQLLKPDVSHIRVQYVSRIKCWIIANESMRGTL